MSAFVPPRELWEATTAVLEVGHDPDLIMRRGLEGLCRLLSADRADGGRAHPGAVTYSPTWAVSSGGQPPSHYTLPLDDHVLRQVLSTPKTFVVHDVRDEIAGSPTGELMMAIETRAMVVRRLERASDGDGVICIDWVGRPADIDRDRVGLVEEFVTKVLSPVFGLAIGRRRRPDPLSALTAAEWQVAELAAGGCTYRDISIIRGTSVNTVAHQLSSARRKLGAPNTAALVRLLASNDHR